MPCNGFGCGLGVTSGLGLNAWNSNYQRTGGCYGYGYAYGYGDGYRTAHDGFRRDCCYPYYGVNYGGYGYPYNYTGNGYSTYNGYGGPFSRGFPNGGWW
jgi:hypothetical protein